MTLEASVQGERGRGNHSKTFRAEVEGVTLDEGKIRPTHPASTNYFQHWSGERDRSEERF